MPCAYGEKKLTQADGVERARRNPGCLQLRPILDAERDDGRLALQARRSSDRFTQRRMQFGERFDEIEFGNLSANRRSAKPDSAAWP